APYLAQAGAQKADAVYAFIPGADAIRFVKQWKEFGIGERLTLTGHNVLADDTILPALGDAALGLLTIGGYTPMLHTPENKAFVGEYQQAYNTWPSRYSEAGWTSAALINAAVDELKGDLGDRQRVRDALRTSLPKLKGPAGPMDFDQYRQVIRPLYILR